MNRTRIAIRGGRDGNEPLLSTQVGLVAAKLQLEPLARRLPVLLTLSLLALGGCGGTNTLGLHLERFSSEGELERRTREVASARERLGRLPTPELLGEESGAPLSAHVGSMASVDGHVVVLRDCSLHVMSSASRAPSLLHVPQASATSRCARLQPIRGGVVVMLVDAGRVSLQPYRFQGDVLREEPAVDIEHGGRLHIARETPLLMAFEEPLLRVRPAARGVDVSITESPRWRVGGGPWRVIVRPQDTWRVAPLSAAPHRTTLVRCAPQAEAWSCDGRSVLSDEASVHIGGTAAYLVRMVGASTELIRVPMEGTPGTAHILGGQPIDSHAVHADEAGLRAVLLSTQHPAPRVAFASVPASSFSATGHHGATEPIQRGADLCRRDPFLNFRRKTLITIHAPNDDSPFAPKLTAQCVTERAAVSALACVGSWYRRQPMSGMAIATASQPSCRNRRAVRRSVRLACMTRCTRAPRGPSSIGQLHVPQRMPSSSTSAS